MYGEECSNTACSTCSTIFGRAQYLLFEWFKINLYFTFIHSMFDMTKMCGIYLDLFYQTSQAFKSPNTLRTPTMLQQDLAMKAEALKQVDEFWMGWLGW